MFKACIDPAPSALTLESILPDLDRLAAASGLIVRQTPRFSAGGFLLTLLKAVSTGDASYSQMAASLGDTEPITLSRQAFHQRLKAPAIAFLQTVLQHVATAQAPQRHKGDKLPFKRILMEDATQFRMHPKNHGSFRAVANDSGATAGAKVDVVIDLISGGMLRQKEEQGHVQDRTLGPTLLPMVRKDDLVLRDMGYFDVAAFAGIESRGAFWLSRLHGQASAALGDGSPLEASLASAKRNSMELEVTLTKHGHPARLIAVRASPEVAARRRQQKKDKRKRNGTQASKQALAREDWNILVTNIPAELCTAEELIMLYRQRWEIEIHFRGWKQSLHMRKALQRITSHTHLHAMILAAMIFSALVVRSKCLIMRENPGMRISGEKLFGWLSGRLKVLRNLLSSIPFDPRHFCRCKRNRETLQQKGSDLVPLN